MKTKIKHVVIVGAGSAGWLTAGIIAAEHKSHSPTGIQVTLIESPDIKSIGVGEGTWPTMRISLQKMGISETTFIRECSASFKQGAKFVKWSTGRDDDFYYHPLVIPTGYLKTNLASFWAEYKDNHSFAELFCYQGYLCDYGRAPKQLSTPEYAAVANYAYHLDAGKFTQLLHKHCTKNLGVKHILDHVIGVNSHSNGDIKSVKTQHNDDIEGDLFIDCTGFSSRLLGGHYSVPFMDKKDILFNDSALAVQVPYQSPQDPIASHTIGTAHSAGWIWDIALPSRRGVGCVYSSAHMSDQNAEQVLNNYLLASPLPVDTVNNLDFKKIAIRPGHRERFWYKNCVAVGMAAGFLEPLEASALVLVELSASMISEQMPANREIMEITAKRFNEKFLYRWDRIIEFLKLHYAISQRRDSDYWIENCQSKSIPERLQELIKLWQYQPPSIYDFPDTEEVFPSASYQYVLYGMGFKTQTRHTRRKCDDVDIAKNIVLENRALSKKYVNALPSNRELIEQIKQHGLQKI